MLRPRNLDFEDHTTTIALVCLNEILHFDYGQYGPPMIRISYIRDLHTTVEREQRKERC